MSSLLVGVGVGLLLALIWRFVRERGHSVYGVTDSTVQSALKSVITRYTTVHALNMINSGPTHQQVYRGGTVVAWFEDNAGIRDLPNNARSFVVWGERRRRDAANALVASLKALGHTAAIEEPLVMFPAGTFLMVTSDAFIDCAIAFRPHWIKMAFLEATAKGPRETAS